jgi:hypothetical protein
MIRDQVLELARQLDRDGDELVEWWSERAAIREIDGGQLRADAESDAFDELRASIAEGRRGPLRAGRAMDTKRNTADGD